MSKKNVTPSTGSKMPYGKPTTRIGDAPKEKGFSLPIYQKPPPPPPKKNRRVIANRFPASLGMTTHNTARGGW